MYTLQIKGIRLLCSSGFRHCNYFNVEIHECEEKQITQRLMNIKRVGLELLRFNAKWEAMAYR